MNNKINYKNVVITTALLLIIMTIGGLSYAYFTHNYEEGELFRTEGSTNTNTPDITFTENKSGISLTGTYPMPDAVGLIKSDDYIYTVTSNEPSKKIAIKVIIEITSDSTLADNLVNFSLNDEIYTLTAKPTTISSSNKYKASYIIETYTLEANASKTSTLKLWVNENGNLDNAQNKTWTSKILVIPEFAKPTTVEALLTKANSPSTTTYSEGNKGEMYAFTHPATTQTESLTDYRFIGDTPNNYVEFNDELWRIIGVFTVEKENGEIEQLTKIMKDVKIDNLMWNETSSNEWSTSTLKTLLNGSYLNDELNDTARNQIENVKWYLGGITTGSTLEGPDFYSLERGTTVYGSHTTNIIQKVGLMYPSDYIYTYAYGVDNACFTDGLNCKTDAAGTPNKGWMHIEDYVEGGTRQRQWTQSPISSSSSTAFDVLNDSGGIFNNRVTNAYGVRPTVYLSQEVKIISGSGTVSDIYHLG